MTETTVGRELIFGVSVQALPDNYVALEVVSLVKALDEDGDPCWLTRVSEGVSDPERIGILEVERVRTAQHMVKQFVTEDDDDA